MRATIRAGAASNEVVLWRDDSETGERIRTVYFVPRDGGYVRIRDRAGAHPQVCEGLRRLGNTLMATPETLAAVIRRELRR